VEDHQRLRLRWRFQRGRSRIRPIPRRVSLVSSTGRSPEVTAPLFPPPPPRSFDCAPPAGPPPLRSRMTRNYASDVKSPRCAASESGKTRRPRGDGVS
jgi:hypothetical protein